VSVDVEEVNDPEVQMASSETASISSVDFSFDREEGRLPEPWYFGFLVFFAYFQLGLGGVAILLAFALLVLGAGPMHGTAYAWLSLAFVIELFFVALAVLFFAAVILLAVDAAQTLRAIRHQLRR